MRSYETGAQIFGKFFLALINLLLSWTLSYLGSFFIMGELGFQDGIQYFLSAILMGIALAIGFLTKSAYSTQY